MIKNIRFVRLYKMYENFFEIQAAESPSEIDISNQD